MAKLIQKMKNPLHVTPAARSLGGLTDVMHSRVRGKKAARPGSKVKQHLCKRCLETGGRRAKSLLALLEV
eukprot:CAMPEP_0176046724 /NCGR_PEP_ID=MMETSP0120_2-20121206/23202_1 /TAXON_ID=160619 /ORGANISM="Kryptoperidinium foliaceum, Strain CCMP 1326" /LENGTH=69 /DNA_ID=CAMNT_0017380137 /DNA_START=138 /DNA_END=344 /DNA_ORIENTATION=+